MNFFSKIFSKKPEPEQKIDTAKQTLPKEKKVETQVKQETKPDISLLKCSGCKKEYEIGKNAVAVCLESQAPGTNILVVYDNNTERVDLVAPIDPSNKGAFERAKPGWKTIQDSLANGQKRKWKCNLCNLVNSYPNIKFTLPKQKDTESTLPKQKDIETSSFNQKNTFTDSRDGKTYKTVKIGNQVWMAENLCYKPNSGNYWAYENNQSNVARYGYLYDWQTAEEVCPSGWHLPSKEEFKTLSGNFGGGGSSSFSALLGGWRDSGGKFFGIGSIGFWWSCSEVYNGAWNLGMMNGYHNASIGENSRACGFSVRCLQN